MNDSFKALLLEQRLNIQTCEIRDLDDSALPGGDVTVAVEYSSLNYKDGLAVTGTGKIIRQFPMVPGIDLAGTVLNPRTPATRLATSAAHGLGHRGAEPGVAIRRKIG